MSEDRLPLYCAHNVLLLWQHGDMTEIPPQVVHSYKGFNGKLTSCLKAKFSMQNTNSDKVRGCRAGTVIQSENRPATDDKHVLTGGMHRKLATSH